MKQVGSKSSGGRPEKVGRVCYNRCLAQEGGERLCVFWSLGKGTRCLNVYKVDDKEYCIGKQGPLAHRYDKMFALLILSLIRISVAGVRSLKVWTR